MSCHGCATKFGIFVKELGCPGCGFAFCSKCLRYKRVIPKFGAGLKTVCRFCFIGMPDEVKKEDIFEPPAAYLKRLEALENPAKPPIVIYKTDTKMEQLKSGLAEEDRNIVQRLEKLREDRKKKHIPSEEEIRTRLLALKDQSADIEGAVEAKRAAAAQFVADTRSDEEKTNDLLKQLMKESALDAKEDETDKEIAKRLAKLRADEERVKEPKKDKASGEFKDLVLGAAGFKDSLEDLEDPPLDEETNKLLERLMKEGAMKAAKKKAREGAESSNDSDTSGLSSSEESNSSEEHEELKEDKVLGM